MNKPTNSRPGIDAARESFSGRLLTDAQFGEAMAITDIVHREIQNSGSFKEKLADYAHAFARSQRFDAVKADTILRDLFKERTGKTMNAMRETFVEREAQLTDRDRALALEKACGIADLIERGPIISFRRAFAHQAEDVAGLLGITDTAAKTMMRDDFKAAERTDLLDWGKELEQRFYRPQVEAEQRRREQGQPERTERRERSSERNTRREPPSDNGHRQEAPRRYRTGPSGP